MDTVQLVEYINIELKRDTSTSVNKIIAKLGEKQSTVKSKLRRGGYVYNADGREYTKEGDKIGDSKAPVKSTQEGTASETKQGTSKGTKKKVKDVYIEDKKGDVIEDVQGDCKEHAGEDNTQDATGGSRRGVEGDRLLDYLLDNVDALEGLVRAYRGGVTKGDIIGDQTKGIVNTKKSKGLTVKLPEENNRGFKTSVRVNDVVFNEFREFCKDHKEFSQKELLSMALLEYLQKHSK